MLLILRHTPPTIPGLPRFSRRIPLTLSRAAKQMPSTMSNGRAVLLPARAWRKGHAHAGLLPPPRINTHDICWITAIRGARHKSPPPRHATRRKKHTLATQNTTRAAYMLIMAFMAYRADEVLELLAIIAHCQAIQARRAKCPLRFSTKRRLPAATPPLHAFYALPPLRRFTPHKSQPPAHRCWLIFSW